MLPVLYSKLHLCRGSMAALPLAEPIRMGWGPPLSVSGMRFIATGPVERVSRAAYV